MFLTLTVTAPNITGTEHKTVLVKWKAHVFMSGLRVVMLSIGSVYQPAPVAIYLCWLFNGSQDWFFKETLWKMAAHRPLMWQKILQNAYMWWLRGIQRNYTVQYGLYSVCRHVSTWLSAKVASSWINKCQYVVWTTLVQTVYDNIYFLSAYLVNSIFYLSSESEETFQTSCNMAKSHLGMKSASLNQWPTYQDILSLSLCVYRLILLHVWVCGHLYVLQSKYGSVMHVCAQCYCVTRHWQKPVYMSKLCSWVEIKITKEQGTHTLLKCSL